MMNGPTATRKRPDPVPYPRTRRPDRRKLMTSARAGKMYPAAFIPLNPEESVVSSSGGASQWMLQAKMEETEKVLSNGIQLRAHAYFVSLAALDRFDGVEDVMNAWAGKAGAPDIIDAYTYADATHAEFYEAMGEHIKEGESINSLYVEAYNLIINHRRELVSESLPSRTLTDHTLGRSLWGQTAIARIVPTFDQALIEGEFDLSGRGRAPVSGIGAASANTFPVVNQDVRETGGTAVSSYSKSQKISGEVAGEKFYIAEDSENAGFPGIYAELEGAGLTVSLSSIDQAKKTRAFAQIRQQFSGHEDELVDLLMRGWHMPNTAYRDPIHLGTSTAGFGYNQRYATDAANLDQYVANGVAQTVLPIRLPTQPTGGVIVLLYEIIPEPVFDRQADMFLRTTDPAEYPNALRDTLDPQQVDVVPNRFVDALHTTPDGTFGYAPMNFDWVRQRDGVGGRFLRDITADASAEDQQHIWSVRTVDPVLDEDAFLVPADLAHNVFQDTVADPFILQSVHSCTIEGITQFGPALFEASGDYEAVAAIAPAADDQITPPAS